jgi:hypothetical protein
VTDHIKYYVYAYSTYIYLFSLDYLSSHQLWYYFPNYSNPPCQLSLWEETGARGENPRHSTERWQSDSFQMSPYSENRTYDLRGERPSDDYPNDALYLQRIEKNTCMPERFNWVYLHEKIVQYLQGKPSRGTSKPPNLITIQFLPFLLSGIQLHSYILTTGTGTKPFPTCNIVKFTLTFNLW